MTSPRFRILNPSGFLIADRSAPCLHYKGKATLVQTVQPSGSVGSLTGRRAGYSQFQFTSSTPVFPVFQLPSGCVVAYDTGGPPRSGDTWNIYVYCGNSTVDSYGFATQVAPEVYMFGPLAGAVSGVGLRLRDDSGNLTHAYTDTGPLPAWFKSRVSESGASLDLSTMRSIASFSKPAAVGFPLHTKTYENWTSSTDMRTTEWKYGWKWDASSPSQLALVEYTYWQNRDSAAGPPAGTDSTTYGLKPSDTLIMDASLLT